MTASARSDCNRGMAVQVRVVEGVRPQWSLPRMVMLGSLLGWTTMGVGAWSIHKGWRDDDTTHKAKSTSARTD